MPVQPTYPGVYIEELPSGVRTIAGVSTSTAAFVGRAKQGPMDVPVLCLSFADFERTFSSEYAESDLARQVRLFFENGGSRCYVMRIAQGAQAASVTLKAEDGTEVLKVTAKSKGVVGDKIRLAVTYRGPQPESTFNLEVFRWGRDAGGNLARLDSETLSGLSMDPASPRYVETYVEQNSKLIKAKAQTSAPSAGYSQSGRPLLNSDLVSTAKTLIVNNATNKFRIRVGSGTPADIDLGEINFDEVASPIQNAGDLAAEIARILKEGLPPDSPVAVTFETGPSNTTVLLKISSTAGDVRIEPASDHDLTGPLMLGSGQGGLEVSRYADRRPAPTGVVLKRSEIATFAALSQDAITEIKIGTKTVALDLQTTDNASDPMLKDAFSSATGNSDGVREKLGIIASKINEGDPSFGWRAEVWGSRLAILPTTGEDNRVVSVTTSGNGSPISLDFLENVRYYSLGDLGSLGSVGAVKYQTNGTAGNDGSAPKLQEYRDAFEILRKEVDLFNLLLLPADEDHTPDDRAKLWGPASTFCQQQRAFLLIDAPDWKTVQDATHPSNGVNKLRQGVAKDHAAVFYPRVTIPANGGQVNVGASGAVAGLMARIDASRGVWKAPAGTEADIRGIVGLERRFSDLENGVLNPRAINTLRIFSSGIVNWGARTLDGDDDFGSQWKYVPVRRLALYIEESLYRGTQWVVFEPNDEPLWAQIRLNVGAFMHTLFRQGAFQGKTPQEAYLVKCDRDTTTQDDVNRGVVNVVVGFAPLKPAEFVIIKIQQLAGQVQT